MVSMIHPHIQWGNTTCVIMCGEFFDTPSHTMRELMQCLQADVTPWYTLTYSEGTRPRPYGQFATMIHPHIQWGNSADAVPLSCISDTPLHTVRELYTMSTGGYCPRYTLTYSEGTKIKTKRPNKASIHPHIQWGNYDRQSNQDIHNDTPSHTVREHWVSGDDDQYRRYTLTYSEGTIVSTTKSPDVAIHPHIQWGNCGGFIPACCNADTPSHTVRERIHVWIVIQLIRYTLTYSEGTVRSHMRYIQPTIHPHIQWGNLLNLFLRLIFGDTPSHTVREQQKRTHRGR